MAEKTFTQQELDKIVSARIGRERARLTKVFEKSLKSCMESVQLAVGLTLSSFEKEMRFERENTLLFTESSEESKATDS